MGLGLGADSLRQFTRPAQELYKLKDVPQFSTVIVDCCASGRKQSSGRECSASLIARQIACNAFAKIKQDSKQSLVVFCFDASELHTPMREVCSQRRYARPTANRLQQARPQIESGALRLIGGRLYRPADCPYSDFSIESLTIHSEVRWNGLFNSAAGKTKAWLLMEEALKTYVSSLAGTLVDKVTPVEQVMVVIDGVSSSHCQVFRNGMWKAKRNICSYGEADLKLQAWCEKFARPERPALLITIDSDAVAIAMCNNAPVSVELARTWRDAAGQQYFSSAAAKKAKAGAALVEVIDIPLMGSDRPDTLMRVAMILIAGGCDYSKGLLCCGLLKDAVMEQAISPPSFRPWIWREDNTVLVNMGELISWIGSIKSRKTRKGTTVEFFCLELHRILWTIAYWCGCGRSDAAWGPPVDLGIGSPDWIKECSEDASSVDSMISTAASSTQPQIIGKGSFTPDLDAQEYAVRVGLYGLIPLLIPLCIGIAALTVHFTRKVYFSKRWLGSLLLVPTVGLLIWALVVSGTASPVAKVNDSINPVKQWSADLISELTIIENQIDNIIADTNSITCSDVRIDQTKDEQNNAKTEFNSLKSDIVELDSEIKNIEVDSYLEYDEFFNLYGSLIIGILMLLPIILLGIFWPLQQLNRVQWFPSTIYIVLASISTFFMGILSIIFLVLTIVYSDGCNDIDTFLKRTINQESFNFYSDCTTSTEIYPEFKTFLDDHISFIGNAQSLLEDADPFCPEDFTNLVSDFDTLIDSVNNNLKPLLQCGTFNNLYEGAKEDACGNNTYSVILHLHQSIFSAYVIVLLFWGFIVISRSDQYTKIKPRQRSTLNDLEKKTFL